MKTTLRATAAILGTAGLLLAGPAWAGGPTDPVGGEQPRGTVAGLKYVTETLDVGSSGHFGPPYEAAWIACGGHASNWHPTGGGVHVDGDQAANRIAATRPMDLDAPFENPADERADDWLDATVRSVVGRSMTGYAVCTQRATRYRLTDTPDQPTSSRRGSTACPSGLHLIGGGAFIATTDSHIQSSWPGANNTWHARIFDMVGGAGGMETYAQCRRLGGVQIITQANAEIEAGVAEAAVARCGPRLHVIGGGGRLSGPVDESHLAASLPIDGPDADRVPDDGWKATGYVDSGPVKRLVSYALCVRKG